MTWVLQGGGWADMMAEQQANRRGGRRSPTAAGAKVWGATSTLPIGFRYGANKPVTFATSQPSALNRKLMAPPAGMAWGAP